MLPPVAFELPSNVAISYKSYLEACVNHKAFSPIHKTQ